MVTQDYLQKRYNSLPVAIGVKEIFQIVSVEFYSVFGGND